MAIGDEVLGEARLKSARSTIEGTGGRDVSGRDGDTVLGTAETDLRFHFRSGFSQMSQPFLAV